MTAILSGVVSGLSIALAAHAILACARCPRRPGSSGACGTVRQERRQMLAVREL